jgi:ABC-type multidrug transport system ATPase subunit
LTVKEHFKLVCDIRNIRDQNETIKEAALEMNLEDYLGHKINKLSEG